MAILKANEIKLDEAINIMSTFDSVGFTDKFSEYLENVKTITGWKDNDVNKEKNTKIIHKSHQSFNPTARILQKFLEINRQDYLLYYTMNLMRR